MEGLEGQGTHKASTPSAPLDIPKQSTASSTQPQVEPKPLPLLVQRLLSFSMKSMTAKARRKFHNDAMHLAVVGKPFTSMNKDCNYVAGIPTMVEATYLARKEDGALLMRTLPRSFMTFFAIKNTTDAYDVGEATFRLLCGDVDNAMKYFKYQVPNFNKDAAGYDDIPIGLLQSMSQANLSGPLPHNRQKGFLKRGPSEFTRQRVKSWDRQLRNMPEIRGLKSFSQPLSDQLSEVATEEALRRCVRTGMGSKE
eukprot:evm.model.scf_3868.1 EVM.evm.TU.scf_3868.1   scf_3868:1633-5168(+)